MDGWCRLNEKTNAQKREIIAQEICDSEAFARLMVGCNTVDAELNYLRELWYKYVLVDGGYGRSRAREHNRDEQGRFF